MFHHVSLFRLRSGVTLDRVRVAKQDLAALVETLPGVHYFAVTDNLSPRGQGFTLALFSIFESREAFEICQRHPAYRQVFDDQLQPVIAETIVAEGEGDNTP